MLPGPHTEYSYNKDQDRKIKAVFFFADISPSRSPDPTRPDSAPARNKASAAVGSFATSPIRVPVLVTDGQDRPQPISRNPVLPRPLFVSAAYKFAQNLPAIFLHQAPIQLDPISSR